MVLSHTKLIAQLRLLSFLERYFWEITKQQATSTVGLQKKMQQFNDPL